MDSDVRVWMMHELKMLPFFLMTSQIFFSETNALRKKTRNTVSDGNIQPKTWRLHDCALPLSTVAGFHIDCDVDILLCVMLSKYWSSTCFTTM